MQGLSRQTHGTTKKGEKQEMKTQNAGVATDRLHALVRFFFECVPTCCYTKWWHGHAFYDARRNRNVMVIYPLHWVVNFAWWLNWKWFSHRHKETWIDRMVNSNGKNDCHRK